MSNILNKILVNVEGAYRSGLGVFQSETPLVGVYGVTSVGKSTFLNALLKSREFKVGLGETTKKVHVIKDFENQKNIDFKNVSLPVEYVFKKIPLLKQFSIVDVPGSNKSFSDGDIENIVKELDVIVWVFDIQGDVSRRDVDFLKNVIVENMVKTIVILNKIDSGMSDIDFDDDTEKNEFIEDVESRRDSILDLFKSGQAEDLLVTVFPMSSKKLFSGVTKNKNLNGQHKAIEEILISVSKSCFVQKEIFRNGYGKVKSIAIKDVDGYKKDILKNKVAKLKSSLKNISDNDILEGRFNENQVFDRGLPSFGAGGRYRSELEKINKKIEGIVG